jgi:hypothetical protein
MVLFLDFRDQVTLQICYGMAHLRLYNLCKHGSLLAQHSKLYRLQFQMSFDRYLALQVLCQLKAVWRRKPALKQLASLITTGLAPFGSIEGGRFLVAIQGRRLARYAFSREHILQVQSPRSSWGPSTSKLVSIAACMHLCGVDCARVSWLHTVMTLTFHRRWFANTSFT